MEEIKVMCDFLTTNKPILLSTFFDSSHRCSPPLIKRRQLCLGLLIMPLSFLWAPSLRHLDLSNNSLTTLPRETLATAPQLETLSLQANPWSCDCRMNWILSWSQAHKGDRKPLSANIISALFCRGNFLCVPAAFIWSKSQEKQKMDFRTWTLGEVGYEDSIL